MELLLLDELDKELINRAKEVIFKNFREGRHTVGSAVLCGSGKTYVGINIESCGFGPCAEQVALGCAFSNGETEAVRIVAVAKRDEGAILLAPCGNCRQMLIDYSPNAQVIVPDEQGYPVKARISDLLPLSYLSSFD